MKDLDAENNKEPHDKGAGPTRSFDGLAPGPGSRIGPFRIEQELGRGGAGVVYLAHDAKLDRSVAIIEQRGFCCGICKKRAVPACC